MLELYGRNGGPVHREGYGVPQNGATGYCSSPPSTSSILHGLLFIHHRPPPASTCDCSSTGSCSSSLHRALLHRLLFNHPSPQATVQPPLHRVLFNQPSTGSCSSSPPRGPVHPAATASTTTGSCSSNPPSGTVHPNPLNNAHCSSREGGSSVRSASVSSCSEGITQVQLTARDRPIARVQ